MSVDSASVYIGQIAYLRGMRSRTRLWYSQERAIEGRETLARLLRGLAHANFEHPMQDMPKQPHDGCHAGPAPPLCPAPGCRRRSAFRPCAGIVQPIAALIRDPWYIVRATLPMPQDGNAASLYAVSRMQPRVSRRCSRFASETSREDGDIAGVNQRHDEGMPRWLWIHRDEAGQAAALPGRGV